jgi:hypothetical protein
MIRIEGEELAGLDFNMTWLGDLLTHEGPLISLYKNDREKAAYYLVKWVDHDEQFNRWVVVPCDRADIVRFFEGQTSLRELLLKQPETHLIDLDASLQIAQVFRVQTPRLPEDFLPMEESFYSEALYSEFARDFHRELSRAGPEDEGGTL